VPHTPETEGLMGKAEFRAMRKSAFLINIGRGACVKLDELVEALRGGEIAGAGLDVFEIEPLPPEHALWNTPGVLLTPHIAGIGPDLQERRTELLLDNCLRFDQCRPLRNIVEKGRWF